MKKWVAVLLVLMMVLVTACDRDTAANEKEKDTRSVEQELNLANILLEEGGYGWQPVTYGSSINDAEKQLNVDFPKIPDFCDEWANGTLPYHPEDLKDYRNTTDYEYVSYAAYIGEKPLLLNYGEYKGHMVLDFYRGGLYAIILRFGEEGTVRDPLMNYGGKPNDVDAVYAKLYEDLTALLGEPTKTVENKAYGGNMYSWIAENSSEGYTTRVQLNIEGDDQRVAQVSAYRIVQQ